MRSGTAHRARVAVIGFVGLLLLAALLRLIFPTADPPWHAPVGITWHDEGPWVHNARNKVLFGAWILDAWNPIFLAPVFTLLEYVSFSAFGVGTWQARLVSQGLGWVSVLALATGVRAVAGPRAALYAAALLGTNYTFVMWNRVALLETAMTAFIVIGWACYANARRYPALGAAAALATLLAFFSKAAAAFFVAALGVEALLAIGGRWWSRLPEPDRSEWRRAGIWSAGGLAVFGLAALALFVVPWWEEFRFYNWQMSVVRKPSYTVRAFVDRLSWIPVVHDFFTRQWVVTVVAVSTIVAFAGRWRRLDGAERLLALWVLVGLAELVVHDTGNERRFVFLIPAMVALAAITLGRGSLAATAAGDRWRSRLLLAPLVFYGLYIVVGGIGRLPFLYEIGPAVRLSAAIAAGLGVAAIWYWPRIVAWVSKTTIPPAAAVTVVALVVAGDLVQFGQWERNRTYENVNASRLVGEWLPPGTLVHGKLANGLALENRIRPVFIGRGFGNYEDRTERPDVRYVLTFVRPWLGYEGPVIRDVLEASPGWRVLHEFDVSETPGGRDRAVLIEKAPQPEPQPGEEATLTLQ